jgi:hypothetical protein
MSDKISGKCHSIPSTLNCSCFFVVSMAMVAILNPKWPPIYKNPPIWAKFGFQVDYDVANWYPKFTEMLSTMRDEDKRRSFWKLKFLSLKIMCTHVRQNFWKVSSNSEHFKFFVFFVGQYSYNLMLTSNCIAMCQPYRY